MNYIPQKSFDDPETATSIYNTIEKIILKVLKNYGIEKHLPGVVSDVDGNYADVKINGATTATPDLVNKTGETLIVGDEVWVLPLQGNSNNYIIDIRKRVT